MKLFKNKVKLYDCVCDYCGEMIDGSDVTVGCVSEFKVIESGDVEYYFEEFKYQLQDVGIDSNDYFEMMNVHDSYIYHHYCEEQLLRRTLKDTTTLAITMPECRTEMLYRVLSEKICKLEEFNLCQA